VEVEMGGLSVVGARGGWLNVIGDWEEKDEVVMGLGEVETCGICAGDVGGGWDIGIDDCEDNGAGRWTRDVLWLCVGEGVDCCEEVTCGGVIGNVEAVV
jgi:hypothetical protein